MRRWALLVWVGLAGLWASEPGFAQVVRPTRTPTPTKTLRGGITATPTRTPSGRLPSSPTPTAAPTPPGTTVPSLSPTAGTPPFTPLPTATPTPIPFGATISFRSATQLNVGQTLSGIAAGNLDPAASSGEFLDVAVADESGVLRWLQGRGSGNFRVRTPLDVAGRPLGVAIADWTGDGLADLATVSADTGTVTLFAGAGNGSFVSTKADGIASDPRALVAVDELLAVADAGTESVAFLRADGAQALFEVSRAAVAAEPVALASGDLTGDGLADLAVGHRAGAGVLLLRRDGETFSPLTSIPFPGGVSAVGIGDLNNDGRNDLIIAGENAKFAVYLNPIRAGAPATFTGDNGSAAAAIVVVDDQTPGFQINGDGRPDLLLLNRGANDVAVWNGFGDGRFELSARLVVGPDPIGLVAGDFIVDDRQAVDLVSANRGDGSLSIIQGNGGGSFQAALSFATGPRPIAAVTADFDRDSWPDLVTLNQENGTVSFLRGNGRGALRAPVPFAALPNPTTLAAGDFDGDGFRDLVVTSLESGRAIVLPNSASGFGLQRPIDLGGPTEALQSVDLNGDGLDDLIAMQLTLNRVVYLLSQGTGFGPPQALEIPGTLSSMTVARVAGDSNWDIVVGTSEPPAVAVFIGGGDFFSPPLRTALPLAPDDLVVDDFIVDGWPDVAALSRSGQRVYILAGNGSGLFTRVQDLPVPAGSKGLVAADFNGNGAADLAFALSASDRVAVFAGSGTGEFLRQDVQVGRGPSGILVANLNVAADPTGGLPELVTVNTEASTVTVLRNITRATALPFTPTATVGPETPTPREPPSPIPTATRRPRSTGSSGGCSVAKPPGCETGFLLLAAFGLLVILARRMGRPGRSGS